MCRFHFPFLLYVVPLQMVNVVIGCVAVAVVLICLAAVVLLCIYCCVFKYKMCTPIIDPIDNPPANQQLYTYDFEVCCVHAGTEAHYIWSYLHCPGRLLNSIELSCLGKHLIVCIYIYIYLYVCIYIGMHAQLNV